MSGGMFGADVAQLRETAARLGQSAEQLTQVRSVLGAAIAQATWHGPDAEQFRGEWEGAHSRALLAAASRLQEAAATLQRNAVAQESTSAADGGSGGGGSGPVLQTLPDRILIGDREPVLPDETGGRVGGPDLPSVPSLPDIRPVDTDVHPLGNLPQGEAWRGTDR